jgi:sterol desaturase/sphingolipid hydroxylase (fatty acid hydroxylase superfamily)
MREGRHMVRRLKRTLRRRSIVAGLALALSRFFLALGLVVLTLWSYALWGSTTTPLRVLLWPAIILLVAAVALRLFFHWYARVIHRAARIEQRRAHIRRKVRLSRLSNRKLNANQS